MPSREINVGMDPPQKIETVRKYLTEHTEIESIVYLYPTGMKEMDFSFTKIPVKKVTFYFSMCFKWMYELLEEVSDKTLLIYDEFMRVKKRRDLTYNLNKHYSNQTSHVLVFEHFPIIDSSDDFMILVDLAYSHKFEGKKFSREFIEMEGVKIIPRIVKINKIECKATDEQKAEYRNISETILNELETGIRKGGPDEVIMTELTTWAGSKIKKAYIKDDGTVYIGRTKRFGKRNKIMRFYSEYAIYDNSTYNTMPYDVHAKNEYTREFDKIGSCVIVDFPASHRQFTDFLKFSGVEDISFLCADLKTDEMIYKDYCDLFSRMEEVFYASGLH